MEKLIKSDRTYRILAEKSPNMVFINIGGRIVYANNKCVQIMGYPKDILYSRDFDFISLIAPESRALVSENLKKHMDGEEVPPYEYKLLTSRGKEIIGLHSTKLINFGGKKGILGIITDITELRTAEKEIENLARFPAENPNPVLRISHDEKVLYYNQAVEILLKKMGLSKKDLIKILPNNIYLLIKQVLNTKKSLFLVEIEVGDQVFSYNLIYVPEKNYVNLYGRDITERKEIELKLHKKIEELEKWQRLTVKREARMVEIKNENESLKKRLAKYESV
jgi:PAS domain S-box-containing protein